MLIATALKEWNLTCNALLDGSQAILLRKGGILDSGNHFELEHSTFWLFPTFIHQDPDMVKPAFRPGLTQVREEPAVVHIAGYGQVSSIHAIPSRHAMDQLCDLHLWSDALIDMRFNYRPEKPLYLVIVQAFRLATPITLANTLAYAGCKSWIPLESPLEVPAHANPALTHTQLAAVTERVLATIQ